MSESGPLKGAGFGTQQVTVQNPTVQNPTNSGADLSKFGNTEDDSEAEDAKKRDALTQMLSLLGFPDLPATRTDLMNQAAKLQALQGQITAAIQELQAAGSDFAGVGSGEGAVQGPPSPENATKIAALNDLQLQLKEAGETFQNYAYSYFASQETSKPLSLSQGQILRAYNEGVLSKQDAAIKLKELKMADDDINILLKLEEPKSGGGVRQDLRLKVQSPTVLTGGKSKGAEGEVRAEDGSYVPKSFFSKTDNRPVPEPSSGGGSGGGSGSDGYGKRMTQAELDALAATLLERAKGGR